MLGSPSGRLASMPRCVVSSELMAQAHSQALRKCTNLVQRIAEVARRPILDVHAGQSRPAVLPHRMAHLLAPKLACSAFKTA
jgi:hypothetical protein